MDVTDENEKLNRPTPSYSQQHVSSPSHIPQMIITSADDVSEEQKNVTECTLVLIPPSNGHSTDKSDRDISAEFTELANSDREGKPVVHFEDISVVVRDVVSKCTESVSHSVRQRPLVMETEKNVQIHENSKDSSSIKCPPLPPPVPVPSNVTPPPPPPPPISPSPTPPASSPLTAIQRPLVFEEVASKTEPVIELQKDMPLTDMTEIKGELICDKVTQGIQHTSDVSSEGAKSSEECTPIKKEGFHGVKKFFDSLLHSETPETEVKLEETEPVKESDKSPNVSKSEKDVKKILQSPKDSRTELSHSPELPSENKETTSFTKDAKQNIKSFFDSFKHEAVESKDTINIKGISSEDVSNEQTFLASTSDTSKDGKETTSFTKDAKHNIKALFDTFKHEPSEPKKDKKSSLVNVDPEIQTEEKVQSRPESPRETTSFTKDAKQNIKALFDTFKHEPSEPKKDKKSSLVNVDTEIQTEEKIQSRPESPRESTSFAKDAKENIKAFFDTFKHESGDPKHKSSISKKSASQPNIDEVVDSQEAVSENIKDKKESASFSKDAKQNIKALFDTFKPETKEQKPKTSITKQSGSQPVVQEPGSDRNVELFVPETPKESSPSFVKDTKQNIKSFFDTFKSESNDLKPKDNVCKKSASHSDFNRDSREIDLSLQDPVVISKEKEAASFAKGAKQNVKTFFDTLKHESSSSKPDDALKKAEDNQSPLIEESSNNLSRDAENIKPIEQNKESSSFVKDTKQNIKSFFKHDSSCLKTKETSSKTPTASEPNLNKQPTDEGIAHQKDTKHSIKKFFSFKHIGEGGETISPELSGSLDSQLPKESGKNMPLKVTKSVRLDLNPKYSTNGAENMSASFTHMNGHETELISEKKERAQSVPSDAFRKSTNFGMLEAKGSEVTCLDFPCESPTEHKDSRQSIKRFFDSFKHEKYSTQKESAQSISSKKESSIDLSSVDLASVSDESKVTEKPKKNKSIKRSFSDKVSREEVVQNFKGFFDSISHRVPSKRSLKDSEHIYDVVEVKTEPGKSAPSLYISNEADTTKNSAIKSESQGMKKILSPFRSKDSTKSGSENIYATPSEVDKTSEERSKKRPEPQKLPGSIKVLPDSTSEALKDETLNDLSPTVSEPGSPKPEKSSMFNAIGENIIALKDKMLHSKEKRKSELFEDSVKVSESPQKSEMEKNHEEAVPSTSNDSKKENNEDIKAKPIPAEKPKQPKVISAGPIPQAANVTEGSNGTPSSLYDSCCMKIAVLLRDKALDIVSDRTKSPPPKPPKPTAEAIAKARAATISRRLADVHKKGRSVGESFPIGCDSMRFVDDDTESSCDYKDLENFDYIMDYELLNRYKVDNSKLDTFSASSGLTSYYTADTVTSRDEIYSDALMETISLGSDVSYNLNRIPSVSKSEPKISPGDNKKNKKESVSSKQSPAKKVPPPIPPKPLILQNISKIKDKPDEKTVSQCVNGLSLSPRLKNKFSKDPAATQKRPLMVADIKGTQFSSLQHSKKSAPQKPARNFDTVLRNESLKNVPCVSSDNVGIAAEKMTKGDSTLKSIIKVEKRTISPPRPPPPNIAKKPEKLPKPERPPPPVRSTKNLLSGEIVQEKTEKDHVNELADAEKLSEDEIPNLTIQSVTTKGDQYSTNISPTADKNRLEEVSVSPIVDDSDKSLPAEVRNDDFYQHNLKIQQDSLNNNIEISKDVTDSLNNNIKLSEDAPTENPKPPPRIRRIRSRTVEAVPTEKQEERLKRSNSLSEIDVQKRVTFLNAEKAKVDSNSLYTTINKNAKRSNNETTSQSSPDLVSCRPLPAPPPPPRRFRSLERKSKSKAERKDELSASPAPSEDSIKAPSRRKKTEKQRFFSLHSDQRKEIEEVSQNEGRAMSVPSKPDRKKTSAAANYDVNANISDLDSSQDFNFSNENIPNVDTTDSLGKSTSRGDVDSRKRSLSSWYDTNESLGESWETIDAISSHDLTEDVKPSPQVPLRRKLETKRKSRETSKFYVNMDEEASPVDQGSSPLPPYYKPISPLSLVDKETSPLPLDCSEKSVQTSLETLSQGVISRDEQSEDISRDEQSEDTDELLDLAQTLQKELSVIINRHKSVNESTEDTPSPPLSAAASEKNLAIEFKETKKASSARSSTSEVWPITSSDESDIERVGEDSSNINEVAVKRKQKKIFYIAREIMTSEEAFVDALKLLNVDFKAAVEAANKQKNMTIIPDEALAQILNHLPQLQHLNENLLMELKDRIENWDKHEKIADIIVKMGPFLKLYSWYIHDFESNVSLLEDCKKKYPAFAQVVKEFEMSARCKRLTLNHYMLKPIQRIPQYRLLLQEYFHHLMESSKDFQDTVAALQIVSEVANHANDSMKHGDNAQKLISIQNSIMGHKEIVKPGRIFVKEGELMKLSRKGMQPRWFVLFNDLLLYLTPVQQGLYRVNHELPLTGMKVAIPIQQDYQNEFSIISVTRSFTLAARSQEERQEWIIALTKAIEENASKRSTFTNSRLNQKAQDKTSSEDEAAFVLGRKAPVWIPDARVTMCQLCTSEFTVTFRRHHCRACGKVVCSICSSHRISLPYLGNRIARVCDECHIHLGQGSSACTESGETDSDNQQIAVKSHLRTDNRHLKKNKRVLPSVLKEVCANDQGSTISGYLHKRTAKSWKRDWFVVKDKVLYEYKASEDVAALKSTPLLGYEIELFSESCEGVDVSLLFQLTHPGQAPIVFYADTVGSAERWVSALKTATVLE